MYQAENVTLKVPYTVIFSGKKIYRYVSRTSESDVLLKSVIPGMPAYFLHDCTSGMFKLMLFLYSFILLPLVEVFIECMHSFSVLWGIRLL